MKIRRLKKKEIRSFVLLFQKVFRESFKVYPKAAKRFTLLSWTPGRVLTKFKSTQRLFLVVENEDRLIGFLVGKKQKSGVGFIVFMGVLKKYQGKGLGQELVLRWENWAKRQKIHKLRATTTNSKNVRFYKKLKYVLEGKRKKDAWGLDNWILGKRI